MKIYITLLTSLLVSLFAINSFAWDPPPRPINGGYVADLTNTLTQSEISQLNRKIEEVNRTTKNEMGALILPSMDGSSIEDVAQTTFRSWGVGKKGLDNGVLVVISIAERKSRIQTGKGVEGDLPDLKCNDILRHNLNPHLKNKDYFGGLNEAFSSIASSIESRHNATVEPKASGCSVSNVPIESTNARGIGLLALTMLSFFGLITYNVIRRRREAAAKLARQEAANEVIHKFNLFQNEMHEKLTKANDVFEETNDPITLKKIQSAKSVHPKSSSKRSVNASKTVAVASATAVTLDVAAQAAKDSKARRERQDREESERRARRQREEEESRSSSSYSSSYDSGSSSDYGSSSSFDSGSGFGGGDSSGGGSSSDF